MIDLCGLEKEQNKLIRALSKGYRQRVGLAQALLHDPEVLILDEPTTGLDPNQIIEIRKLIKELGKEKTVILSSHILAEVEATCDRILIINKGKIVADGTSKDLRKQSEGREILKIKIEDGDKNTIFEALQKLETVGTLAAGIAHDFNNILSAIIGYSELVRLRLTGENEGIKNDLAKVLSAAERAKQLVSQILAFSRKSDKELHDSAQRFLEMISQNGELKQEINRWIPYLND